MSVGGRELVPTQSMMLELTDEYQLLVDGQEFLDQKRMLLAGETLRWLALYDVVGARLVAAREQATVALAEAVARHGLAELQAYADAVQRSPETTVSHSDFLGVPLRECRVHVAQTEPDASANPSPELRRCVHRFRALLTLTVEAAGIASNLHRLEAEYRRTERRARALEDVLMPEIRDAMKTIGDRLEEHDQEEAIRVRIRTR